MLLYIYLGTTVYVWIDTIKNWKQMDKRLKEEGYVSTANRGFNMGDFIICALTVIALSLPGLNLLFPIINHDKDASYDNYKNYLEEAGAIEKKDLYKDTTIKNDKNIIKIKDVKLAERINKDNHIYYSSYSDEESKENRVYTYKKVLK